MNKADFFSLIEHSGRWEDISLVDTERMISQFPYWQSARLIYAKALKQKQHFSYQSQIKLTAIYAGDRKKLFELISSNFDNINATDTEKLLSTEKKLDSVQDNTSFFIDEPKVVNPVISEIDENIGSPVNENVTQPENKTIAETIQKESISDVQDLSIAGNEPDENELSKIIEQRLNELILQNTSYGLTPPITETTVSINDNATLSDNIIIQPSEEIETGLTAKDNAIEDHIPLEEELAAFDVYEETSIADDLFKQTEPYSAPSTDLSFSEADNESEINLSIQPDSGQHTFLDWFTVLKFAKRESQEVASEILNIEADKPETEQITLNAKASQQKLETQENNTVIENTSTSLLGHIENTQSNLTEETTQQHNTPESLQDVPGNAATDLISKFIQDEPRIQPKKNAFFSPSEAARKSVVYNDEVVSETLAEIFFRQQLYDKAIKAYEKLTLMFPEKSPLFAARIQKIKEESGKR